MYQVYGVYKNADMTEGKGPMVLDRVYQERYDAEDFLKLQSGVMGRRPAEGETWDEMGDWQIKPLDVLQTLNDGEAYQRQMARNRALAKLRPDEIEALGISI